MIGRARRRRRQRQFSRNIDEYDRLVEAPDEEIPARKSVAGFEFEERQFTPPPLGAEIVPVAKGCAGLLAVVIVPWAVVVAIVELLTGWPL